MRHPCAGGADALLRSAEFPVSHEFQHQLFGCLLVQAATGQELDKRIAARVPSGGGAEHDIKLAFIHSHPDSTREPFQTDHTHTTSLPAPWRKGHGFLLPE